MTESALEIAAAVRSKQRSAQEVLDAALSRIEALDPATNAFCAVDADRARAAARALDARIAAGDSVGALAGVPIGVKDLEDAAGFRTTCGDPARANRPVAVADSVEVARMKAAGAVVVGKTNTPAYGFHAETDNLIFGPTRNPWALGRTAGGSSGGSAAAVASGLVPMCTGSDGGGSIRIPSTVCGISGFKPTHGVVPMGDADAPTWGPFSTRGPMARTFAEIALGLDVVKGLSNRDLLSMELDGSFVTAAGAPRLKGVRVIWSPTLGVATPSAAVLAACEAAVAQLEAQGAIIIETLDAIFTAPPIMAWIARAAPGSLHTANADPMPWEGRFLPEATNTASYGSRITAEQMIEGEAGAHLAGVELAALYERCDVLIAPGLGHVPPRVREESPAGPGWGAAFTLPFNLVRAPAASIHCGFVADDGDRLPVSIQIAMPRGADLALMSIAAAAEAVFGISAPPHSAWTV